MASDDKGVTRWCQAGDKVVVRNYWQADDKPHVDLFSWDTSTKMVLCKKKDVKCSAHMYNTAPGEDVCAVVAFLNHA